MEDINQRKAGAILSYVSIIVNALVQLVYTPVLIRFLGQSEYGLYNLVSSVVSYLGLLNFGFGSAYVRFYSKYKVKDDKESVANLNGMFLIIFSIIAIVALLAGAYLVLNVNKFLGDKLTFEEISIAKILMSLMVLNLAISFPLLVFSSYITANEQFIFQKLLQIVKAIINLVIIFPILLMGYKSIGVVVATIIITIFIELSNIKFCATKLKIKFSFDKFDFRLMKEMMIFSSFIFINMIVDQINWNVDKFIIGRYRGTVGVAVYGVASQLNIYYMTFATAISSVFIPKVNRIALEIKNSQELNSIFSRIGRIQFIVLSMICLGFIFFGKPFINMWVGPGYSESYIIALILIIPGTFSLIQNIGIEIQRAKNMHQFRSLIYLIIAILNILLSIPLTKIYGGIGAALGTSIAIVMGNIIIMNIYYQNKIGIDIKSFWKQIFKFIPALIIPCIAGILIILNINLYHEFSFIFYGIMYFIIFVVSMWLLGMNQYEKELVIKPIRNIYSKIKTKA